jgi:hypothetical protein
MQRVGACCRGMRGSSGRKWSQSAKWAAALDSRTPPRNTLTMKNELHVCARLTHAEGWSMLQGDARQQWAQVESEREVGSRTRLSDPTAQHTHHEKRAARAAHLHHNHKCRELKIAAGEMQGCGPF